MVTTSGKVLVLAGAGSGKTKVLISRIAYLLATQRAVPKAILGLTFTNKAAQEMRNRLTTLVGPSLAAGVTLSTFHSFCLKWLRHEAYRLGFTSRFSLYQEQEVRRLLQQMAHEELEQEASLPSLEPTFARIDKARQLGLRPRDLPVGEELWHHNFSDRLFSRLQQAFRAYNAMDFNALIEYCVELMEKNPEVRATLLDRFHYVMIDEYQDTNPIQDRLAKLLAGRGNLCVVGDDDQSIYGWRGGQVRNILDFPAEHFIKLEQNYRSTPLILRAANEVISKNCERFQKTLWSDRAEGEKIELFYAPGQKEEAKAVVQRLLRLKKSQQYRWRDFAILYRSNSLAQPFESALIESQWQELTTGIWRRGIPYEVFGGQAFYDCREVRDLLAYLRIFCNAKDLEAALRIINQPRRGIGEATVDALTQALRQKEGCTIEQEIARSLFSFQPNVGRSLESFLQLLQEGREKFSTGSIGENIEWLLKRIGYEKAILEEVKSEKMRELKRKNLRQFVLDAIAFEESSRKESSLSRNLEGFDLLLEFVSSLQIEPTNSFALKNRQADAVQLMTFHSAKGLEFESVYLVGLEDHILPHERTTGEHALEEERRLFYVALTRAKKHLTLSMATIRSRYGKDHVSEPSRFLFDISKEILHITGHDRF